MKVEIIVEPAVSYAEDGWQDYQVTIYNANYNDRDKFKKLKLIWCPELKAWYTSGAYKASREQVKKYLENKYGTL